MCVLSGWIPISTRLRAVPLNRPVVLTAVVWGITVCSRYLCKRPLSTALLRRRTNSTGSHLICVQWTLWSLSVTTPKLASWVRRNVKTKVDFESLLIPRAMVTVSFKFDLTKDCFWRTLTSVIKYDPSQPGVLIPPDRVILRLITLPLATGRVS